MSRSKLLAAVATAAAVLSAAPAQALTFNFSNQAQGGAEQGTQARRSFDAAAAYWSSVFTNSATVNIAIGFYSLGAGNANVLGSAGSSSYVNTIASFTDRIGTTRSNSGVDVLAGANLPGLTSNGGVAAITPGYVDEVARTGIDTSKRVYDTDGSINNRQLFLTTANAKALGYSGAGLYGTSVSDSTIDAEIQFNSDFNFDFDPTDGIDANKVDFTLVALHEIGHALGFVSGVDSYDYFGGPSGPCFNGGDGCGGIAGRTYNANNDVWASALDMFRYSSDAGNAAPGDGPVLDWSIRNPNDPTAYPNGTANPYFSIDGGATRGLSNEDQAYFARGSFNGASSQASHWRRVGSNNGAGNPTQPFVGIMDPVGRTGNYVTALDIAAFDAIGWNSTVDALNDRGYARTTAQIYAQFAGVPEPATWGMMLAGFFLTGASLRSRRRSTTVRFA